MFYHSETEEKYTKQELIKIIMENFSCTKEQAESHIDYSLKHGILIEE